MASNAKGGLELGLVTRGRGKVFVAAAGLPHGCALRARTAAGEPAPAQLVKTIDNTKVLTAAVLTQDQTLSVLDAEGAELARVPVPAAKTALSSKFNTFAHREGADKIRNADVDALDAELELDYLIDDFESRVARGRLSIWGVRPEDADKPLDLLVLAGDGHVASSGWVRMGGGCADAPAYPGVLRRTVDFSLRIPEALDRFFVWARYAEDGETIAFNWYDPAAVAGLKAWWDTEHVAAFSDDRYHDWFCARHRADERELGLQRATWRRLAEQPTFSLVATLSAATADQLRQLADSVLAQTYPELEFVLVNADPADAALAAEAARLEAADPRVRVVVLERGLGAERALEAGARAATGEFIGFAGSGDVLEPDLLFRYAKAVNDEPECDLLYCDEDELGDGRYAKPFFKPDWDPVFLCSAGYVRHLLCVRASVVRGLPERPGRDADGAQELDLAFLVGERARAIVHVPRVLYHVRAGASEAGALAGARGALADAARERVVQAHLDRLGLPATAHAGMRAPERFPGEGCYVEWALPEPAPLVSIVIPSHEAASILRTCVESIYARTTYPNYEIVVVENGSREPATFALYEELQAAHGNLKVVTCEQPDGFNFSRLINCGAAASAGEFLLMLNNDTEVVTPDWLELMAGPAAADASIGCVGAKLLYPDDTIQHVGVSMGRGHGPFHVDLMRAGDDPCAYGTAALPHQMSAVTGACILVRKALFDEVGGLDESLPVDFNDIDFCMRLRARGCKNLVVPHAVLHHYESVSRGAEKNPVKWESLMGSTGRFAARWGRTLFYGDPFYSKNFRFNDAYHHLDA